MKARTLFTVFFVLTMAAATSAQKLGGYKEIAKTDSGAQAAAEYAVSAQAEKSGKEIEFISVFKAERQTVAGTNYRLCIKVSEQGDEDEADAIIYVQTVVYVDLKGNKKLTSWTTSDCGSDDEE
jgi:hypothetical protein